MKRTDGSDATDALFEQLFQEYQSPILNYLLRLVDDPDQAEELCQDVFVRAYRALPRLPQDANHRAWLYRIASNAATDRYRRSRLLRWLPLRDDEADSTTARRGDDSESRTVERHTVQKALKAVPLGYRQALVLFSVQGYSIEEISGMMGISAGAVKTRLFRAREKFRAAYERECGDAL